MKTDDPIMLYLRSRLNMGLLGGAVAVALVGALFFGPLGKILVPLSSVIAYLAVTVGMLGSRRGAQAIVGEKEEDRTKALLDAIRATEAERERIAVLRIADAKVRKAVEYFLQVSGEYIEACRRLSSYSPQASDSIHGVLDLLQIYLERLDGASTEEEYGLKEQDAAQGTREQNVLVTVARIHEAATSIRERMASDLAMPAAKDRLELMDEMEGKQ